MDPATIAMLVAQLGPAAMQFFQGRKQLREGRELAANTSDPIYNIPASQIAALAGAEKNASSRYISGQTALQDMLNQGTANAASDIIKTGRSSLDVLSALTTVNAGNQQKQLELGFQASQDYENRQRELRGEQRAMATFEDKKWTNDVLNKFLRDSSAASALQNAGMVNQYQGAKAGFNALGSFGSMGGFDGIGAPKSAPAGDVFSNLNMSQIEQPAPSTLQAPTMTNPTPPQFSPAQVNQAWQGINPEQYNSMLEFFKAGGYSNFTPSFQ